MEEVVPFDWYRIFFGDKNSFLFMLEVAFRVTFMYVFALFILRYMGKRGNKSLTILENLLIIALGSATGDAMFYPNVPLIYACFVITLIVAFTRIMQWWQLRSPKVNQFLDGFPILLVEDGKLNKEGLNKVRVTEDEFFGMLRGQGIRNLGEIQYAFLERTGQVGFLKNKENELEGKSILPEKFE